jgi:hypothetical protein
MQVIECTPTSLALPAGGSVQVRTVRWMLPEWPGTPEDPPGLPLTWARKPAFLVEGRCLRAEFAILDHLRLQGWHGGVWVNAFGNELRTAWFPAPAFRAPGQAGAPPWAARIFDELRAANGGKLTGFFDVFAWREPGQAGFFEAKVGTDTIRPSQRAFLETALRFRPLDQFTIIEFGREHANGPPAPRGPRGQACRPTRRPSRSPSSTSWPQSGPPGAPLKTFAARTPRMTSPARLARSRSRHSAVPPGARSWPWKKAR